MPVLYIIWSMVLSVIPYIVIYVVRGLGFGLVAYIGVSVVLDQAESFVFSKFDGLGSSLYSIMSILGIPLGMKIIFSAFGVAIAIKTAVAPAHPVWRKPGSGFEA